MSGYVQSEHSVNGHRSYHNHAFDSANPIMNDGFNNRAEHVDAESEIYDAYYDSPGRTLSPLLSH